MKSTKKMKLVSAGLLVVAALLQGCSSVPVNVAPKAPAKYEILGAVSGSGCGTLGLVATAYYFVPLGLNGRVESAYKDALSKIPGATGLIDVEMTEDWYWILLGTMRCTKISGKAIKGVAQ